MNIETIKSVYFVGAGGIGMSALVRYFLFKGKVVAGYDRTPTPLTETLIAEGAQIHYEENIDLIPEACKDKESTIRNTETRPSAGNNHSFEQRLMRSRNSWQDHHVDHDCPPAPPVARGMYRLPRRNLKELRHQLAAFSKKPLHGH